MLRGGPGVGRELEELRHGKESSEDGSGHQDGSSQGKEWEDPAGAYCQLLGGSRRLGGDPFPDPGPHGTILGMHRFRP